MIIKKEEMIMNNTESINEKIIQNMIEITDF